MEVPVKMMEIKLIAFGLDSNQVIKKFSSMMEKNKSYTL